MTFSTAGFFLFEGYLKGFQISLSFYIRQAYPSITIEHRTYCVCTYMYIHKNM